MVVINIILTIGAIISLFLVTTWLFWGFKTNFTFYRTIKFDDRLNLVEYYSFMGGWQIIKLEKSQNARIEDLNKFNKLYTAMNKPNKLYRATNKSNNRQWIIADSESDALDIAIKSKFVRNKNNCKLQTSDKNIGNFYKSFKERGNDMTQVNTLTGVGFVEFKNENDKGTWLVKSWW